MHSYMMFPVKRRMFDSEKERLNALLFINFKRHPLKNAPDRWRCAQQTVYDVSHRQPSSNSSS